MFHEVRRGGRSAMLGMVASALCQSATPASDRLADESPSVSDAVHSQYVWRISQIAARLWPKTPRIDVTSITPANLQICTYRILPAARQRGQSAGVLFIMGLQTNVFAVEDKAVRQLVEAARVSGPPKLTVPQALRQAEAYLQALGEEVPPAHTVSVQYGPVRPLWTVRWAPTWHGFARDDFEEHGIAEPMINLSFSEAHGFLRLDRTDGAYSGPASLEVNVQPREAAKKAVELAPLAQLSLLDQRGVFFRGGRARVS